MTTSAEFAQAKAITWQRQTVSCTVLQRRLKITYSKAVSMIYMMERQNLVTCPDAYGRREILDTDPMSWLDESK
jgi:DNA segregation ATPase FtsK/SpoIIIE-like protein